MSEANGEEMMVYVTKSDLKDTYNVAVGEDAEDLIFEATGTENILTISEQTLNEEYEFDVITLSGKITKNEDELYIFDFEHEGDNEGISNCINFLTKL